jgi:hypothetical protein
VGLSNRGETSVLRLGGGGGGGGGGVSLFCLTKRIISEVVPEGRTFDQSLINISFPKIVG